MSPQVPENQGLGQALVKDEGNSLGKFPSDVQPLIAENTVVPTEFAFINLVAGYFEQKCIPSSLYLAGIR